MLKTEVIDLHAIPLDLLKYITSSNKVRLHHAKIGER